MAIAAMLAPPAAQQMLLEKPWAEFPRRLFRNRFPKALSAVRLKPLCSWLCDTLRDFDWISHRDALHQEFLLLGIEAKEPPRAADNQAQPDGNGPPNASDAAARSAAATPPSANGPEGAAPASKGVEQTSPAARAVGFMYDRLQTTQTIPTMVDIAAAIGVSRPTLYRSPTFANFRAARTALMGTIHKGAKDADRNMEAYDDDED